MALTVEEKISKLEGYAEWEAFSEQQKNFLLNVARGETHLVAVKNSYPTQTYRTHTSCLNVIYKSKRIRQALAMIDEQPQKKLVADKQEMIEILTRWLRSEDPDIALKAFDRLSKLQGLDKEEKNKEPEPVDVEKLVRDIEKKKREEVTT